MVHLTIKVLQGTKQRPVFSSLLLFVGMRPRVGLRCRYTDTRRPTLWGSITGDEPMRCSLLTCLTILLLPCAAFAQNLPAPRLNHVFPMGGKAGSTLDLKVVGQDVASIEGLHFSFPGAKVEVVGSDTVGPEPKKQPGKPAPNLQA